MDPLVSAEDLRKHSRHDDAWVAIDGVVYDVTKFASVHPGGALVLLRTAGTDATKDFNVMHSPAVLKRPQFQRLRVGRLDVRRRKEERLPFSDHYWLDPRGTLQSPFITGEDSRCAEVGHVTATPRLRHGEGHDRLCRLY